MIKNPSLNAASEPVNPEPLNSCNSFKGGTDDLLMADLGHPLTAPGLADHAGTQAQGAVVSAGMVRLTYPNIHLK